jgi:hypothetical protein
VTTFLIAPRVGYALMFSDMFGIWPRGGITFFSRKVSQQNFNAGTGGTTEQTDSVNGFSLTVEVPFIISPVEHIGITIAPTLDFPITGSGSREETGQPTVDSTVKTTDFGISAGLLTWF